MTTISIPDEPSPQLHPLGWTVRFPRSSYIRRSGYLAAVGSPVAWTYVVEHAIRFLSKEDADNVVVELLRNYPRSLSGGLWVEPA